MDNQGEYIISGPEFTVPIPDCSLGEYLIPKMKSQPRDNIMQVDSETGVSETCWEVLKKSIEIAKGLLSIGLQENDVVAMVSKDRSELYAATLGVIWIGAIAAPIGPKMTVYETKHMFELIQPKYVFSEDDTIECVEKVLNLLGMNIPIILFDFRKNDESSYLTFEKLIRDVDVENYNPRPINSPSTRLALIVISSGASGLPKGVGLTHRNIIFQLATWESSGKPFHEMPTLQWAPFFWISGALTLFVSVSTGMRRIFVKNSADENVLQAMHTYKPTWAYIPPSAINSLMSHPNFKKYDVSSIKLLPSGGSAVSEYLINKVKKDWSEDTTVVQLYGLTESTGMVTEADPENIHSVGKLKPGCQLKVVDMETTKSLRPNKIGELYMKSNGLMKCYVGNPEATKDTISEDGWLITGDLGYYDDNEYIYIVDRIKEMIKFKNWQVPPAEIENLIESLPGVVEAGVVGIPNEKDLYHPMALVVKENGSNVIEDDIIRVVRENLSDCKHLRGGVKFVDSIPRTPTGKIKRPKLKELAKALLLE